VNVPFYSACPLLLRPPFTPPALDAAVLAAYGFDPEKDLLAQLLELNLTVAAREKQNLPVTAPGVPPTYGDPHRWLRRIAYDHEGGAPHVI
jgi:hypothetical protein